MAFRVLVKDVKELVLPEVTDEWASEASEFDTVEELTADIAERLPAAAHRPGPDGPAAEDGRGAGRAGQRGRSPRSWSTRSCASASTTWGTDWSSQGLSLDQFLGATGRDEQALLDELRVDALQSVKADLALRALADAEGIQVDEAELEEELVTSAERLDMDGDGLREQLERAGFGEYARNDEGQSAYVAARPCPARRRGRQPDLTRRPGRWDDGGRRRFVDSQERAGRGAFRSTMAPAQRDTCAYNFVPRSSSPPTAASVTTTCTRGS